MTITINNYHDLKKIPRKKILRWDKQKDKFVLRKNIDVKQIVKGLRYVRTDFEFSLRKKLTKKQIQKAENAIEQYYEFKERENVREYHPSKKNRKLIANLAMQPGNWKVYFIPSDSSGGKLTYKTIKGKKVAVEQTKVATYINLYFNFKNLIKDSDKEVDRLVKDIPNKDYVRIHAGKYLVGGAYKSINKVKDDIKDFMIKYDNYEEWMTGLKIVYKFNSKKKSNKSKKTLKTTKKKKSKK